MLKAFKGHILLEDIFRFSTVLEYHSLFAAFYTWKRWIMAIMVRALGSARVSARRETPSRKLPADSGCIFLTRGGMV
jgi:hypothetical protein